MAGKFELEIGRFQKAKCVIYPEALPSRNAESSGSTLCTY